MKPCAVVVSSVLLLAGLVSRGQAQWTLSAGLRAPRFSGGAEEVATGRSLRPYRPTQLEVAIGRRAGRAGVGLRVSYASSSLALEGSDGLAAVKDALSYCGFQPELTVRLARLGPQGFIHLYGGPLIELWKLPDASSRARAGVPAGAGLEMDLGGRWSGLLRAGGAVTPKSPFTRADLDPSLEPRTLWRREVAGAVALRL
jgi:hypothetical protein